MPRLRSLAWALLGLPGRIATRRALARRALILPEGAPALSYGGVPDAGGVIAGGRVKLRHLADVWPEQAHFNVLYLVSSAPPPHALELVKWAQGRGVKFVWNQNGVAFPAWAGRRVEEINRPMRELRQRADFVVYQSEFCRRSAEQWLGPANAPGEVLLNPADLAAFEPTPTPSFMRWELLTAGTHHDPERVLLAIDALAEIVRGGQAARLTVAGRLAWRGAANQVRAAIERAQLTDSVRLLPAFAQAEAPRIFQESHLLLHPKFNDPCPTIVIEALACGVPVIGSASGGMPELLDDSCGALLPVGESWTEMQYPGAREFAFAIDEVMRAWLQRSAAARARAERLFDHRAWVVRHRAIFERLVA